MSISLSVASSSETFCLKRFHGATVRFLFWPMIRRLGGVFSSPSPVHCVVLDFWLSVSVTVLCRSGEVFGSLNESGGTPWFGLHLYFPRYRRRGVVSLELRGFARSKLRNWVMYKYVIVICGKLMLSDPDGTYFRIIFL